MTMPTRDPKSQPQIGEPVTYLPEGVVTKVTGYEWEHPTGDVNHAPKIKRYVLACGVTVAGDHIAQIEPEKPAVEVVKGPFEVKDPKAETDADALGKRNAAQTDGMNRETRERVGSSTGDYGEKL